VAGKLYPARVRTVPAALTLTIALHLALLAYFAPPRVLLAKEPVATIDYSLHAYQVDRALGAFRQAKALWAYDPLLLAGQPAGVTEDLTSKGTELFVIGAAALGLHPGFAFNLFILLVLLMLPAAGYASARLFGLSRGQAAIVILLWELLWFFDSFLHWSWWIGMISWSFVSYGAVLLLGMLHRALESRKSGWYLALAPAGFLLTLVHPFVAVTLAVPCLALYARAFRRLSAREHALIALFVLASASSVLVWIFPFLRFRHYVGDADTFFNAKLSYVLFDAFDLLKDGRQTGGPIRTMFRMLCFAAAAFCLWRWHKQGDRRLLPLGALLGWTLALAYLGGYFWAGRQTQPYRQIGPAMLAAAIPAAELLSALCSPRALAALPRQAKLLLALALVLVLPRFARTLLHYMPDLLPEQVVRSKLDLLSSPLVGLNEPKPMRLALHPAPPPHQAVRRWLSARHAGRGRIVVSEWVLGEYLAASTKLPILGGLVERNVPHVDAHLFRRHPEGDLPGTELADYFETYAVGWVVTVGDFGPLDWRRDLLEPAEVVERYRIYRTRAEPSYFGRGAGRIEAQGLNTIAVADASGPELMLRFHWLETLRCRPDCQLEREAVPGDRVGMIRVPAPPARFEIYNAY
jgi:hypothetical protein